MAILPIQVGNPTMFSGGGGGPTGANVAYGGGGGGGRGGAGGGGEGGGIGGLLTGAGNIFSTIKKAKQEDQLFQAQMDEYNDKKTMAHRDETRNIARAYVPDGEHTEDDVIAGLERTNEALGIPRDQTRADWMIGENSRSTAQREEYSFVSLANQAGDLESERYSPGGLRGTSPVTQQYIPTSKPSAAETYQDQNAPLPTEVKIPSTADQANAQLAVTPPEPGMVPMTGPDGGIPFPELDTSKMSARLGEQVSPEIVADSPDGMLQQYESMQSFPKQQPDPGLNAKAERAMMKAMRLAALSGSSNAGGAKDLVEQVAMFALTKDEITNAVSAKIEALVNISPAHREFSSRFVQYDIADGLYSNMSPMHRQERVDGYILAAEGMTTEQLGGKTKEQWAQDQVEQKIRMARRAEAKGWLQHAGPILKPALDFIQNDATTQRNWIEAVKNRRVKIMDNEVKLAGFESDQMINSNNIVQRREAVAAQFTIERMRTQKALMVGAMAVSGRGITANAQNLNTIADLTLGRETNSIGIIKHNAERQENHDKLNLEATRLHMDGFSAAGRLLEGKVKIYEFIAKLEKEKQKGPAGFSNGVPAKLNPADPLTAAQKKEIEKATGIKADTIGDLLQFGDMYEEAYKKVLPSEPVHWRDPDGSQHEIKFNPEDPEGNVDAMTEYVDVWGMEDAKAELERHKRRIEMDGEDPETAVEISMLLDAAEARGVNLTQDIYLQLSKRPETPFWPKNYPTLAKLRNRRQNGPATTATA